MNIETVTIVQALAPGVALTSMIFYYGNLQSRMMFTVDIIRALNREARDLQAAEPTAHADRISSIRWQVEFLAHRFESIHKAMLFAYGGIGSFIVTIVALLLKGVLQFGALSALALVAFTFGLACLGVATVISSRELRLAHRTILEDIDSSYQGPRESHRRAAAGYS